VAELEDLEALRRLRCRVDADHWLRDLEDAQRLLDDRHVLTLTPDCALPSLFGACEPVTDPNARGFARWPEDKWWWDGALGEMDGCLKTKLHRGKILFLDDRAVAVVDPLCRSELEVAEGAGYGAEAQRVVALLAAAGPTLLDDVKDETGLDSAGLRRVRSKLEPRGVVVSREVELPAASGGHRHVSELALWTQRVPNAVSDSGGLADLVAIGVRAAVLAPRSEARKWFAWQVTDELVDQLLDAGQIAEPRPGWLTAP